MIAVVEPPAPSKPTAPKSPAARKAEETDTRQAIQHHDPEFYRKKKDDGDQPGFKDPYEDLTDVSIPALKNFLMSLVDRAPDDAPPQTTIAHEASRQPANPKAAAASKAYQNTATHTPHVPTPPPPAETKPASALDQAAAGLDRAEVLTLIRDLDRLSASGVQAITLERSGNTEGNGFLASIRAGISRTAV